MKIVHVDRESLQLLLRNYAYNPHLETVLTQSSILLRDYKCSNFNRKSVIDTNYNTAKRRRQGTEAEQKKQH